MDTSPVGVTVFNAKTGALVSLNREATLIVESLHLPGTPRSQRLSGCPQCATGSTWRYRCPMKARALRPSAWRTCLTSTPVEQELIEANHSSAYLTRARQTCAGGSTYLDSLDVTVSEESYDVALKAAGATIALAEGVINEEISNGFALVRPPGHHAEHDQAMGFCILNNVAILARYLKAVHALDKVLILDWDVHHGNGTQHTFEEDPSVLFASTHQYPGPGLALRVEEPGTDFKSVPNEARAPVLSGHRHLVGNGDRQRPGRQRPRNRWPWFHPGCTWCARYTQVRYSRPRRRRTVVQHSGSGYAQRPLRPGGTGSVLQDYGVHHPHRSPPIHRV